MVLDQKYSLMAISIRENIEMVSFMVKENTLGLTDHAMKDSSTRV
jgi:hypothetical protein